MKVSRLGKIMASSVAFFAAVTAVAQDDPYANVSIQTVPVAGNVSMLIGAGGNLGVSAGADGLSLIHLGRCRRNVRCD